MRLPASRAAASRALVALAVGAAGLLCSGRVAFAQAGGRTDGPEGSEVGKGGYRRVGPSPYSLSVDWGAAVAPKLDLGAPLFAGLTAGYWMDDWVQAEATAYYNARTESVNVIVGPRVRSNFYPFSVSAAFKGGAMVFTEGAGLRFGVSPQVSADLLLEQSVLVGVAYALDLPIGLPAAATHRLFMTLGYRF